MSVRQRRQEVMTLSPQHLLPIPECAFRAVNFRADCRSKRARLVVSRSIGRIDAGEEGRQHLLQLFRPNPTGSIVLEPQEGTDAVPDVGCRSKRRK